MATKIHAYSAGKYTTKLNKKGPFFYCDLTVDGRKIPALVDTGTNFTILNKKALPHFDPQKEAKVSSFVTLGGRGNAYQWQRKVQISTASFTAEVSDVAVADLDMGICCGAILGMDLLSGGSSDSLFLDFPNKAMSFREGAIKANKVFSARRKGPKAFVVFDAELNYSGSRLMVDTGLNSSLVMTRNHPWFNNVSRKPSWQCKFVSGMYLDASGTLFGEVMMRVGNQSVDLGKNLCHFLPRRSSFNDVFLGLGLLQKFKCCISPTHFMLAQ